ncbi:hypothetical protein [Sphingomonas sp. R1]|uniref:hypothetical protein n=1 Tax=Sphingomonas sp. R1 TaxID=399176 RepID=UPI002224B309|nr:hypothetical protein [Sphingomonas sp. R1]UYY77185.1 hypothetical protein OIM94_17085 [Sphingomonas sp. R1]
MLPPPDLDSPPEPDFTIASTLGSEEIRAGAGGYDYGWPDATVAIADPRFIDLLNSAEINAVSYALVPAAGGRALPQVDLVAEKAEPLREAFALFERWRAMSGVGSISVSIAPEKTGYTLLIGTDLRALRWRCCGFQNVTSPEAFSLTWAKTLDTRNDFVSSLEAYARNVVAPAFLGAAQLGRTDTGEIVAKALPGVDPILLPGIGWGAPAGWAGRDRTGISEDSGREGDAAPPDATTIARARERRLHAIAPKTLHDLRHTEVGLALRGRLAALGARDWQIGQAITNLGLARLQASQASSKDEPDDRWEAIHALRLGQVELATFPVTLDSFETGEIMDQIGLDAAFLLRRLGRLPGALDFAICQAALRESGHF